MSYLENDVWKAGRPPRGSDALYLNSAGDVPTAAELRESEVGLPAAALADSPPGTAWCTEKQVCIALNLDAKELYSDVDLAADLLNGCKYSEQLGELVFDARDVARRIEKAERLARPDAGKEEDPKAAADALLAELREMGLDVGPLGGDA